MPARVPRKEIARKLPSYQELKRLYVEQGWSFADIAEKYDVQRAAVYQTMKRRALAYGDTWPLRSRYTAIQKTARNTADHYVNPVVIISMVWEFVEEKAAAEGISTRKAMYAFAAEHSLSVSHLYEIRSKRVPRIGKRYAKKLLIAIGEPVDRSLEESMWLRGLKHSGIRKAYRA